MTNAWTERRRTRRWTAVDQHGITWASVRAGDEVFVLNISSTGALIETGYRLLPGAWVELRLRTVASDHQIVRGRLLRSCVAHLRANAIRYRGAILFDRALAWFAGDATRGYSLPMFEERALTSSRVGATQLLATEQRDVAVTEIL